MRDGYVYHLQQGQTFQKTHDLVRLSQLLHAVDPNWCWDEDELEDMAARLPQALLLRLGLNPLPPAR
jgi:hypothetical protein